MSEDFGHEVLQRWRESKLTFHHLTDALYQLRLGLFAQKIEEITAESTLVTVSARTPSLHCSPILEKKVRIIVMDRRTIINRGRKKDELCESKFF